jgi:hypothetical protein
MNEVEDILEHFGVKGMKWGVRRDRGHEGERARNRSIARADKKFEKRSAKDRTFRKLHHQAVKEADKEVASINKKPEYRAAAKSGEMKFDTPTRRRYYNEVDNAYLKSLQRASDEYGSNASGTRSLAIVRDPERPYGFGVQSADITHADEDFFVEYLRDAEGLVVGFNLPDPLEHADVEAILEHFGVKGMKWGVRNDRGHEGERAKAKKIAKLDKKFENVGTKEWVAVHNRAAQLSNAHDIERINSKPKWVKAANEGKLLDPFSKENKLYTAEHQRAFTGRVKQAAAEMGTNASGTRQYQVRSNGWDWELSVTDVQHADDALPDFRIKVTRDKDGQILNLKVLDPEDTGDILEHFGVKGMKWGVRRSRKERRQAAKFAGAQKREPSADFVRSRNSKSKKPFELTDQELKDLNNRLTQEQRLSQLNPSVASKGMKVAKGLAALSTTVGTLYGVSQTPHGKAMIALGSKLVTKPTGAEMSKTFVENLARI